RWRESAGGRFRLCRRPRHRILDSLRDGRGGLAETRVRVRQLPERTLPSRFSLPGLQYRRRKPSGVRCRHGEYRWCLENRSEQSVGDTDRPRLKYRHLASFCRYETARSRDRCGRRRARQRACPRSSAQDLLYEHWSRVLGHRARGCPRSHGTRRLARSGGARQRANLLPHGLSTWTVEVSVDRNQRSAARQSEQLLVDDAGVDGGDGQVGTGSGATACQQIPETTGRYARSVGRRRVPDTCDSHIAADASSQSAWHQSAGGPRGRSGHAARSSRSASRSRRQRARGGSAPRDTRSSRNPPQLYPLLGSYVPFAGTKAERERAHDPRQSIEERYPTRERYLELVQDAGAALVKDHYLLPDDLPGLIEHAAEHWDLLVNRPVGATK